MVPDPFDIAKLTPEQLKTIREAYPMALAAEQKIWDLRMKLNEVLSNYISGTDTPDQETADQLMENVMLEHINADNAAQMILHGVNLGTEFVGLQKLITKYAIKVIKESAGINDVGESTVSSFLGKRYGI